VKVEERGLRREAEKPAAKPEAVKPAKAAKPEAKPVEPVERLVAEIQKLEERGLRREEKPTVKPEAGGPVGQKPPAVTAVEGARREVTAKPEAVKPAAETKPEVAKPETVKPEAVKPAEAKPAEVKRPEAVKPKAPVADVIPERVEAVEYLVQRFGVVLNVEAAFKAKDFVIAKVKTRLEKVAVKEPEFAHILAEVAERALSSFGRLMVLPTRRGTCTTSCSATSRVTRRGTGRCCLRASSALLGRR
jgi:hypothetical protein